MKVLILWADNASANMGVRVLAQGHAALVRSIWGQDVEVVFQDFSGSETGVRVSRESIMNEVGRPQGPIKSLLQEFDLIWDTGAGDSFTDIYGYGRLVRMLYVQRAAQRAGIPVVLGPQTVGPFESRIAAAGARRSMKRMAAIFARDTTSAAYVVGTGLPLTAVATDVVFALPRPTKTPKHDVLINVSGLLWSENPHVDFQKYRSSIHRLCDELGGIGRTAKVLVHVIDNPNADNDAHAAKQVGGDHGLEVLSPRDLDEVRDHTASSGLVIGSRMHACLNALSTGTPTIPWAYSRKFGPLFADLGWNDVIDLRTDPDPVAATIQLAKDPEALSLQVSAVLAGANARLDGVISKMREFELDRAHG